MILRKRFTTIVTMISEKEQIAAAFFWQKYEWVIQKDVIKWDKYNVYTNLLYWVHKLLTEIIYIYEKLITLSYKI